MSILIKLMRLKGYSLNEAINRYALIAFFLAIIGGIVGGVVGFVDKKERPKYVHSIYQSEPKESYAVYVLSKKDIESLKEYYERVNDPLKPVYIGSPLFELSVENKSMIVDTLSSDIVQFKAIITNNYEEYKVTGYTHITYVH